MRNKKCRETSPVTSKVATVAEKIPLVSVVIPMFNAAKFVTQTLESLLYQTMTDFEVVIVDDCSTDNSIEVVESLAPKFNGRLKLVKLPKNTGTPGLPRNVGIQTARGKYIAFLDCDDLFTKTALEELSTLAEKFQADVVHTDATFNLWGNNPKAEDAPEMTDFAAMTNPKNFSVQSYRKEKISAPMLETPDIAERVRRWVSSPPNDFWATCLSFYRRDFLIENQIFFSDMLTCEDAPVTFTAWCLAKNYLRVPNVVYIVRPRAGSVSRDRESISPEKHFRKRFRALLDGFKEFERVMDKIKFFAEHPDYRYAVFKWFANFRIAVTLNFYIKNPAYKLNELVKQEFHSDDAALSAYLFNTVSVYRIQIAILQQQLAALKKQS